MEITEALDYESQEAIELTVTFTSDNGDVQDSSLIENIEEEEKQDNEEDAMGDQEIDNENGKDSANWVEEICDNSEIQKAINSIAA